MHIPAPPRLPSFEPRPATADSVRTAARAPRPPGPGALRELPHAERRRRILDAFVARAERGIEVEELVAWLVRDYRPLCRRPAFEDHAMPRRARAESVGDVACEALAAARSAMEMTTDAEAALDVALAAVGAGHVIEVEEETGLVAWLPVDQRGMRLSERVRSLVACDVLDEASRCIHWVDSGLPPLRDAGIPRS